MRRIFTYFAVTLVLAGHCCAFAADPTFVGILAIAADEKVATELGLSEITRKKLGEVIEKRESDALDFALSLKDLPDEEKDAKMASFVAESEKAGLFLLSQVQIKKLHQVQVAREGLATLARPEVATQVGLTVKQVEDTNKLVAELKVKERTAAEADRRVARAETERKLAQLLTKEQRTAWDALAGIGNTEVAAADPTTEKPATGTPEDEPAPEETKPETTKPETTKPETTKPETTKPETSKPETTKPITTTPKPTVTPKAPAAPRVPKDLAKVRLKFSFQYAPWKDVIAYFAEQADLAVVGKNIPSGTFNYSDPREYSVGQSIDLINSVLQTEGYMLLRRDRMLFVINLEDGIPPTLISEISDKDLDVRGEYEVVSMLFTLKTHLPDEVEKDIRQVLGPLGSIKILAKSKQLYVTETAGKLKTIRSIVQALEGTEDSKNDGVESFALEHVSPDEVMGLARPLLGLPEGMNMMPDGSLRLALDGLNKRILVSGKPESVEKFRKLIKELDKESTSDAGPTIIETPQLKIYQVTTADPLVVLQVMQTMLAGNLNVRLTSDPKTGNLVAMAPPSVHNTIREVLEQMQGDKRIVEVFKLRKVDPDAAITAISKVFGLGEGNNASAPKVESDPVAMQLIVRGSQSQVDQIRELLVKMGETTFSTDELAKPAHRSNVRVLSGSGRNVETALAQIEAIFPVVHGNKIRIVRSGEGEGTGESATKSGIRLQMPKSLTPKPPRATESTKPKTETNESSDSDRDGEDRGERDGRDGDRPRGGEERPRGEFRFDRGERREEGPPKLDRSTTFKRVNFHFTSWQENAEIGKPEETKEPPKVEAPAVKPKAEEPPEQKSVPGAEVVITVGPGGIIISSEDLDALDEIEGIINEAINVPPGKELAVFYLKFAKADVAMELLQQTLGGGSGASSDDGGGSLMGDIASSMMGNMGGMFGGLFGGGGGGGSSFTSSGPVQMVSDNRLNAILAQGKPSDLKLVEDLLEIIDKESSEVDVQTVAKPRFIPVANTDATEMANIVRQVYSTRMQPDANQPRQPSPEDLVRALRGGGGRGGAGGGRGGNDRQSQEQKMTIGVDTRSNSLIVAAPEPLFQEVKRMVESLDVIESKKDESTAVVKLNGTNPVLIEKGLNSLLGNNVTVNRQGGTATGAVAGNNAARRPGAQQGGPQQPQQGFQPGGNSQQMLRTFDAFNQQQRGGQGGGGGRGAGGGGGRGGGR